MKRIPVKPMQKRTSRLPAFMLVRPPAFNAMSQLDYDGSEYAYVRHQAVQQLDAAEYHSHARAAATQEFMRLLGLDATLQREWQAFKDAGGITASEFVDFLNGCFRSRRMPGKRHLRLLEDVR